MPQVPKLTLERLRHLFTYELETGRFIRLVQTHGRGGTKPVGSVAGLLSRDRRRYITIDRVRYAEHRLAWLYMTGEWPTEVDHRNGDPADNRWANLRLATRSQNNANVGLKSHNTSGVKGVHWDACRQKWVAQICCNRKRQRLGRFDSKDQAAAAYRSAAKQHFGEFARL